MAPIPLWEPSRDVAVDLDLPFSTDEIMSAMLSLNPNKTPGLYGYSAECGTAPIKSFWHQNYWRYIVTHWRWGCSQILQIVLIPKPHKDHDFCESYRPISLINVNAKIVAKILAKGLNKMIASVIHSDQTGFIPMRSRAINLRRLFTVLQPEGPTPDTRVVVSLDTDKAFNSIEWPYLWAVLERMGFGPKFIAWVKLLFAKPLARLRVNNTITDTF